MKFVGETSPAVLVVFESGLFKGVEITTVNKVFEFMGGGEGASFMNIECRCEQSESVSDHGSLGATLVVVTPGDQGLLLSEGANIMSRFHVDSGFVVKNENTVPPNGNKNVRFDGFSTNCVFVSSFVGFHHCNVWESRVNLMAVRPKSSVSANFLGEDFATLRIPV